MNLPDWINKTKPYLNSTMLSVLFLGFSSGLPLSVTGSTLQAWYTEAGVDLLTIGFLTMVGQPYVWKFLWAPLVDRLVLSKLGRRRSWMLLTQVVLCCTIFAMAFFNPAQSPWGLGLLALVVAFFSATQDIAIDAHRTELLKPKERGFGVALYVSSYRFAAVLVGGGLALFSAHYFGWQLTYLALSACMLVGIITTLLTREGIQPEDYTPPANFQAAVIGPFKAFFQRDSALSLLILIVLYKLGDAFAGALTTTFLLREIGFSLTEVGTALKGIGLLATLLGTFAGGIIMMRMGLFRALLGFGVLQAVSNLMLVWLGMAGKVYTIMGVAIFTENFCGGLGTVAFVAFLMALCDKHYTATQFALLSALASVGRIFVGPMAAELIQWIGWVDFYWFTFFVALPGLGLLWWLRYRGAVDFAGLAPADG